MKSIDTREYIKYIKNGERCWEQYRDSNGNLKSDNSKESGIGNISAVDKSPIFFIKFKTVAPLTFSPV